MNSPLSIPMQEALSAVSLEDKYTVDKGRVYISGTQAIVRLPMLQRQRDQLQGLNTAGYISGYRGSPLGAVDLALWKAKKHLSENSIVFQAGVNEELAATAVWGTQQTNLWPTGKYDGVFGMWYGKGPGVDRSGDVFKHANSAGTSPHGGVLLLAGDDHAAKSSSVAHQSEHALIAAGIPVLYPSSVQEYIDYGLHGWAMSRYSGLWVGMKCVTDVVESTASVEMDPERVKIVIPEDFVMPADGVSIRWPDPPLAQEARLFDYKWYAALAYVRANKLNRVVIESPVARFGIMTAGKAYLDVRQALVELGLDDETCAKIGIRLLKIGCIWPLDAQDARAFATGLEEILVVEEKRQILEYALKEELYNWRDDVRPKVYGKFDERDNEGGEWSVPRGDWLLPARYELSPALIAKAIATRLAKADLPEDIRARIAARIAIIEAKEYEASKPHAVTERPPWFCSGCPHNTSTKVPEGSRALAGIGCHYMSMWMDRSTETFSQMGGEGVSWLGQMHFTHDKHIFVNLGDGTYFHSGLLAIRAAIAASANVTYKILFNDAVAMTGGQPVDGILTVPQIAHQMHAEGAKKIIIVTDEPEKYTTDVKLPEGVTVHHREQLDDLQRELRDMPGTSILIYDQTCATEKRRRRKRGTYPDPARRVFINDAVCEGCGDCSVKSNCLSVEPLGTPLGTKRKINQSSCNKDFSCVTGFCPSFVTAEGAQMRKPVVKAKGNGATPNFTTLPRPIIAPLETGYGILVTGVGGTGVVTIGGLLGMAAHLENKGVTVLDMAGLAQKGGAVVSHIQIAPTPDAIYATRVATGEAGLIIGCDAIVSASADVLSKTRRGITRAIINSEKTPTAQFLTNPNWSFPSAEIGSELRQSIGEGCEFLDANQCALVLLGDAIYANPLLLGYTWQKGWVPLAYESMIRAIELNAVAVEKNKSAFDWGRYLAEHGAAVLADIMAPANETAIVLHMPESLDKLIAYRQKLLTAYQNQAYADRYLSVVERIRAKEKTLDGGHSLTTTVVRNLAKLMAYKDEYEVARLYSAPEFLEKMRSQFEGEPGKDYQLKFHLAPPLMSKRNNQGELIKRNFGSWMLPAFRLLAKCKGLRGTSFDIFGYTEERKAERALVEDYIGLINELSGSLTSDNLDLAIKLANIPDDIRGFGHVKERNMAAADKKRTQLLARYRHPEKSVVAA
ncbi:indolepyruvate ferredoxin oxidoreductase family protein [Glaciimonas sp. PCH181]|uniref:indolepyruvate ferredoxin oxidoreductase family protein n=1 Tax=Glaciimonas sp. PCH181 TaxID=2133943 RepID=UPI000D3B7803|nr:indolepyruvate ferredoxin oxidoreductase family protein [Glaciimonas sp. PCH181]PUA18611.1 indolepyruvate ferredoxin oxidoreductase family protein [Glaciimonas sp. PCH181]